MSTDWLQTRTISISSTVVVAPSVPQSTNLPLGRLPHVTVTLCRLFLLQLSPFPTWVRIREIIFFRNMWRLFWAKSAQWALLWKKKLLLFRQTYMHLRKGYVLGKPSCLPVLQTSIKYWTKRKWGTRQQKYVIMARDVTNFPESILNHVLLAEGNVWFSTVPKWVSNLLFWVDEESNRENYRNLQDWRRINEGNSIIFVQYLSESS